MRAERLFGERRIAGHKHTRARIFVSEKFNYFCYISLEVNVVVNYVISCEM